MARNVSVTYTRNILVIGSIGTGKSTIVNQITGNDFLQTGMSTSRITIEIQQVTGVLKFDGKNYKLVCIDSVGLIDPGKDSDERFKTSRILSDIKMAIQTTFKAGVSLIFIVLDRNRLRTEERQLFKVLQENFGPRFWKKCYIIFTHCEMVSEHAAEDIIKEFKSNLDPYNGLKQFIGDDTWEVAKSRIKTLGFPSDDESAEGLINELKEEKEKDVYAIRKIIVDTTALEPTINILRAPPKNCNVM